MEVTKNGGGPPLWNQESGELFFTVPPGMMQSVPITLELRVSEVKRRLKVLVIDRFEAFRANPQ